MGWSDEFHTRRASHDDEGASDAAAAEVPAAGAVRRRPTFPDSPSLTSAKAARSVVTPAARPPLPKRSSSSLDRGDSRSRSGGSGGSGGGGSGGLDGGDAFGSLLLVGAAVAGSALQHLSPRRAAASPRGGGQGPRAGQNGQAPQTPPQQYPHKQQTSSYRSPSPRGRPLPPPILMSPRTPRGDRPKTPRSVRFSDEREVEGSVPRTPRTPRGSLLGRPPLHPVSPTSQQQLPSPTQPEQGAPGRGGGPPAARQPAPMGMPEPSRMLEAATRPPAQAARFVMAAPLHLVAILLAATQQAANSVTDGVGRVVGPPLRALPRPGHRRQRLRQPEPQQVVLLVWQLAQAPCRKCQHDVRTATVQ